MDILIIEPNPNLRTAKLAALATAGYTVREAIDAQSGLVQMTAAPADLIILDLSLAGGNGLDLADKLRSVEGAAHIPILGLAGLADKVDEECMGAARFNDFLFKPVDIPLLVKTVQACLGAARPRVMQSGGGQSSLAIDDESSRLKNYDLARRCATQSAQIAVLAQMSDKFLDGSVSRAALYSEMLAQYVDAVGFSCGAILSFDGERRLTTSAQIGFDDPVTKLLPSFFEPGGPLGDVARGAEPLYIAARSSCTVPANQFLSAIAAETAFISPLRFGREELGIVLLASLTPVADSEWLNFAKAVTEQIAQVLALSQSISRLQNMASFDTLTGLPNRAYLDWQLQKAVTAGEGIALYLLNLDRFQEINSTLGSRNGNILLQHVAARLRANLPAQAMVARLGSDEFVVLRNDTTSAESVHHAALQTVKILEPTFKLAGLPIALRATMGVAVMASCDEDADTVLSYAAAARHMARSAGQSYFIYPKKPESDYPGHLALLSDLREAIQRNELALHYQPKVTVKSGETIGVEALLRWRRPGRGWIAPDLFLPLAERAGLIYPITLWVVGSALRQASAWRTTGMRLGMAVNISPHDLHDPEFPDILASLCKSTGTANDDLTLEFTERSLNDDPARTRATLERLSQLGFELSLDDFGTGHCSISDVQALPLKEIKIDQSFIINFVRDARSRAIVRSTIDLGRHLGVQVVAKGIESRESYNALDDLGCDIGQGFYIGRPMPPADVAARLNCWRDQTLARRSIVEVPFASAGGDRHS